MKVVTDSSPTCHSCGQAVPVCHRCGRVRCVCPPASAQPIPGMPGYSVTEDGVVYGKRGDLVAAHRDKDGYFTVGLCITPGKVSKQTPLRVHRLVLLTYVGPPPSPTHEGAHVDGDVTNNKVANLAWKTRQENEDDKKVHGTRPRGERHANWRLSYAARQEIRQRHAAGEKYAALALAYDVSIHHIGRICRGEAPSTPSQAVAAPR